MPKSVMLDTGPLGKLAHPRPHPEISIWFKQLLEANVAIIIPEIADYEVRRSLLLQAEIQISLLYQGFTSLPKFSTYSND
jgi:hypothetical protein